jgi:proteasome accessory factor C
VEIEYHAVSSGETTVRRIDPEEVFHAIGNWYVAAWDHLSGEERLFRADRIRKASPTRERFEPRGLAGAGRPLYTPTPEDVTVTLRLGPGARWVAEYYATERAVPGEDGSLEVELRTSRLEWMARLLLRLGTDASVLAPDVLKDRVRALAGGTRERYELTSPVIDPSA